MGYQGRSQDDLRTDEDATTVTVPDETYEEDKTSKELPGILGRCSSLPFGILVEQCSVITIVVTRWLVGQSEMTGKK